MSTDVADVIEIEDLSKSYGNHAVLRGLSLRVAAGEVYGLLGPNGAGKSTLVHLILGFLKPSSGRLRVLGSASPNKVRHQIGYVPERQRYHTHFTAREYLRFIGEFSGMSGVALAGRVAEELGVVGLADAADRTLSTFSKGMLQRVGVAQALLGDPSLLLIDEPTSGLDPVGQRGVIELLAALRERGHTIFLCTHYLHEIEHLCDRVGVLMNGRLAAEASVSELRGPGASVQIEVDAIDPALRASLEGLSRAVACEGRSVWIRQNTPALQAQVLRRILDAGASIIALEPLESPLEQLYVQAVRAQAVGQLAAPAPERVDRPPSSVGPPATSERRTGEGDTLLNELLRRGEQGPESGRTNPE